MEQKLNRGFYAAAKIGGVCVLSGLIISLSHIPVFAGNCLDEVRGLAKSHNLSIDPLGGTIGPDRQSEPGAIDGGLIEPPQASDDMVMEPPVGGEPAMETLPSVSPPPPAGNSAGQDALTPAERNILQSVLVAARAEAVRGDERGCYDRLQEAQEFASRSQDE